MECAKRCEKKKGRVCPMCRAPIERIVHIHVQHADLDGERVVKVHDSDPSTVLGLGLATKRGPA